MNSLSETVSEDVKRAAYKYANKNFDVNVFNHWLDLYNAFIAGSYYSKPFEHEKDPKK